MDALLDTGASARLSTCGLYRYELVRRWNRGPLACWIMLNPSTADATTDDPTIRRCIGFTRRWNLAGLVVVNLFAYRATNPRELYDCAGAGVDPVGPENDDAIHDAAVGSRVVVAAWGAHGSLYGRDRDVIDMLAASPVRLTALDVTNDGAPKHPLSRGKGFIPNETVPTPWPREGE